MSLQDPPIPGQRRPIGRPRKPGPGRPRASRVVVRDLGKAGVKETNHTSFRLDDDVRRKLAGLAKRKYGGITKSAVVRILINDAAAKEGIE